MCILALGELHIPYRSTKIPLPFLNLLEKTDVDQILCTGNLCTPTVFKQLQQISENILAVSGIFDEYWISKPDVFQPPCEFLVDVYQGYKIGLVSGILSMPTFDLIQLDIIATRLDVDILIFGGYTGFCAFEYKNRLLISPGSATGASLLGGKYREIDINESSILSKIKIEKLSDDNISDYELNSRKIKDQVSFFPSLMLLKTELPDTESSIEIDVCLIANEEILTKKLIYRKEESVYP